MKRTRPPNTPQWQTVSGIPKQLCGHGVKKKRLLVPKMVQNSPALFPQRTQFVNVLYDKLVENGYEGMRALDIEAEIAEKVSMVMYGVEIRRMAQKISAKKLDAKPPSEEPVYCEELEKLILPPKLLKDYIMEIPENAVVSSVKEEVKEEVSDVPAEDAPAIPKEGHVCDRCKTRWRKKGGHCRFHLMRRQWDPKTKRLSTTFPCCGEAMEEGSGCEHREFHVFKPDPRNMTGLSHFCKAPEGEKNVAVGLDCEMAWTSRGFELIRLTVVDFTSRDVLMDRLVWPFGDIWDLNTRFSGVHRMEDGTTVGGKQLPPLTFDEMRQELFKFVSASTILIGHGLHNDLNVLRLVHHRIVDTALHYPRGRTRMHSLKDLAWEFLGRTIQTGEHNSEEDSLAAIDVIRSDIRQRCRLTKTNQY